MKQIVFLVLVFFISSSFSHAQKENFDVVNYMPIKNWKKEATNEYISFSVINETKGSYCSIIIYKSVDGDVNSKTNFDNSWQRMIVDALGAGLPKMETPSTENGWELQTGTASFSKDGLKGSAMLITATSQSKTVNMVVMLNSEVYAQQLNDFIGSIDLKKPETPAITNTESLHNNLVGIWADNILETSGYANGYAQYTAGYFRKEYTFKSDGTYMHFHKTWSAYMKDIRFIYETGTWSASGNTLTISPTKGKAEEWSKSASNSAKEWGKLLTSQGAKLEKVTYTFEIKYYSGSQSTALILTSNTPTERDGSSNNNNGSQTISYASKKETIIDFPPGFNFSAAKPAVAATSVPSGISVSSSSNAVLAGKIWKSNTPEKYGSAYGSLSGFYTGGFWIYQYKFNADGTYSFVYNAASAISSKPVNLLQYETGKYTVNGNQVTIIPLKGASEEWSVGSINNGMSPDHIREVLETRIKKIKSTTRKLEKTTYSFSVEYWQGNNANALCLQHTQNTEREGSPGANNQSCFFETTAQKAFKY